jgi:hypothetical protein
MRKEKKMKHEKGPDNQVRIVGAHTETRSGYATCPLCKDYRNVNLLESFCAKCAVDLYMISNISVAVYPGSAKPTMEDIKKFCVERRRPGKHES